MFFIIDLQSYLFTLLSLADPTLTHLSQKAYSDPIGYSHHLPSDLLRLHSTEKPSLPTKRSSTMSPHEKQCRLYISAQTYKRLCNLYPRRIAGARINKYRGALIFLSSIWRPFK